MRLTMVDGYMDDWYLIERAEHDGREWWEMTGNNSFSLRCSSRIGNACIEGTGAEMLAIARAIKAGESVSFKRCAASKGDDGYYLSSPRNSTEPTLVPLADVQALADEIIAKLDKAAA